jgi:hypothetical protein
MDPKQDKEQAIYNLIEYLDTFNKLCCTVDIPDSAEYEVRIAISNGIIDIRKELELC